MDRADLDIVAKIYEAVLEPSHWPELLSQIAEHLGARGSIIFEQRSRDDIPYIDYRYFPPNFVKDVLEEYLLRFRDLEVEEQKIFAKYSLAGDGYTLITDRILYENLEQLQNQPNAQFLKQHNIGMRVGVCLNRKHASFDRLSLQYDTNRDTISGEIQSRANKLLPHLAKALAASRPIETDFGSNEIIRALVDKIQYAIAIVSTSGEIIYANQEFDKLIEQTNSLKITDQKLTGNGSYKEVKAFFEALGQEIPQLTANSAQRIHSFFNRAKSQPIVFEISPVDHKFLDTPSFKNFRIILGLDTSQPADLDMGRIGQFFPLSPAELEVLGLVLSGHTINDIAEARGRSFDTIKSQYKSILSKTQSDTRSSLFHLCSKISSPITYEIIGGKGR